jgi:hypothetical protein
VARSERTGGDGEVQRGHRGGKHDTTMSARRES